MIMLIVMLSLIYSYNCYANAAQQKPKPVHRRILQLLNIKYENDIKQVKDKPVIIIKDNKTYKRRFRK